MVVLISFCFDFFSRKAQKSDYLYSYRKSMSKLQNAAGKCCQHIMTTTWFYTRPRTQSGTDQTPRRPRKGPLCSRLMRWKKKNQKTKNNLVLKAFKRYLNIIHHPTYRRTLTQQKRRKLLPKSLRTHKNQPGPSSLPTKEPWIHLPYRDVPCIHKKTLGGKCK